MIERKTIETVYQNTTATLLLSNPTSSILPHSSSFLA
jgi:hypothetical protein